MNDGKNFFTIEETPAMFIGGRDYSVDVLRCISCFMVCMQHSAEFLFLGGKAVPILAGSMEWAGAALYRLIFGSGTTLFVMVSGIFFLIFPFFSFLTVLF